MVGVLPPLPIAQQLPATVSSHPRRKHTPSDGSLTPQLRCKGPVTQNKMCRQGRTHHKMSQETAYWDTGSALLRNRLCVPLFLTGAFDSEELHMLNRGPKKWLSS